MGSTTGGDSAQVHVLQEKIQKSLLGHKGPGIHISKENHVNYEEESKKSDHVWS